MPAAVYDRLFTQALAELKKPRSLALCALFAALHIVLNQFTIPVSAYLEIGFDFLALAAAGYLCGPWMAGLVGAAGDVLGYLLRPNGPYFPGFTLSAVLMGILYGLWYYKKPVQLWRVLLAQLNNVVLFNFFITPLWLSIMYGQAFTVLTTMRLLKNLLQFPISATLSLLLLRACDSAQKSIQNRS